MGGHVSALFAIVWRTRPTGAASAACNRRNETSKRGDIVVGVLDHVCNKAFPQDRRIALLNNRRVVIRLLFAMLVLLAFGAIWRSRQYVFFRASTPWCTVDGKAYPDFKPYRTVYGDVLFIVRENVYVIPHGSTDILVPGSDYYIHVTPYVMVAPGQLVYGRSMRSPMMEMDAQVAFTPNTVSFRGMDMHRIVVHGYR